MKQIVQNIRDGSIDVLDVPTPPVTPGMVLVQVAFSVVSAGTERAAVEFGQQNLVQKVRSRPDVINQVRAKIARDGLKATFEAVTSRLGGANALGYSCSGRVVAVGDGVSDLRPGDLVACAGAGYASHAEFVSVPNNLVVPIPGGREDLLEAAAFTTIGAIALQGVRLADVSLGESVAVVGLGLLGQMLVMMLRAAGCTVLGFDPNQQRVDRARQAGMDAGSASADEFRRQCAAATDGHGVDAVLVAAATKSDAPVEMAGDVCRGKGRVVVVGDVGLRVPRPQYFQKEIAFVVSRSYGPGRYDPTYEEGGLDYPYPVRAVDRTPQHGGGPPDVREGAVVERVARLAPVSGGPRRRRVQDDWERRDGAVPRRHAHLSLVIGAHGARGRARRLASGRRATGDARRRASSAPARSSARPSCRASATSAAWACAAWRTAPASAATTRRTGSGSAMPRRRLTSSSRIARSTSWSWARRTTCTRRRRSPRWKRASTCSWKSRCA